MTKGGKAIVAARRGGSVEGQRVRMGGAGALPAAPCCGQRAGDWLLAAWKETGKGGGMSDTIFGHLAVGRPLAACNSQQA